MLTSYLSGRQGILQPIPTRVNDKIAKPNTKAGKTGMMPIGLNGKVVLAHHLPPTGRRWHDANAQKAQPSLPEDRGRNTQRDGNDDGRHGSWARYVEK